MARFHVILNTHQNPQGAIAALHCLRSQESGQHAVAYTMCYDKEDFISPKMMRLLPLPCVFNIEPRPDSVCNVWNRNLRARCGYDYHLCVPDDAFCATAHWDVYIHESMTEGNTLLMGWNDLANPQQFTLPIITDRYLAALSEPFFDPTFKMWFGDTAAAEVHSFATGLPTTVGTHLIMAGPIRPRQVTRAAWDEFTARRPRRALEGLSVRKKLGLVVEPGAVQEIEWLFQKRDKRGRAGCRD